MTSLRDKIGEVAGNKIINRGEKVKVVYFDDDNQKTITGIIIAIEEKDIVINGTTPKTKIPIEKINSIEKV